MARHDVIIIGAGHNGLIAAAYLARAGLSVLILERRDRVGGGLPAEEFCQGFKGPEGVSMITCLAAKIAADLNLSGAGLGLVPLPGRVTLAGDDYIGTYRNPDHTAADIARHSRHDSEAYAAYQHALARQREVFQPFLKEPLPDPAALVGPGRDIPSAFVHAFREMGEGSLLAALRFWFRSCADFLADFFENEGIKAHLASPALMAAARGPLAPGTAFLLLYQTRMPPLPGLADMVCGGGAALARALLHAVRAQGGEVICEAEVARINLDKGRAVGVTLADGRSFEARTVLSNLDVKRTFLTLFDWKDLPDDMMKAVANYRMQGTVARMNIALDRLPEFKALPADCPLRTAPLSFATSLTKMEKAHDDWRRGIIPSPPFMEACLPSLIDPSWAPPGKHVMSVTIGFVPYHLLAGHWDDERRSELAAAVIGRLHEASPGFEQIVLGWDLLVPPDLEDRFALTAGDVFHGDMALDQMVINRPLPGWRNHQTPFDNLFLCGASAHPGAGMAGLAGASAARTVLRTLDRVPS